MAKKKWFDKQASLEAEEIILTPVEDAEVVAWSEPEVEDVTVEAKVSTNELTQADIKWAKANLSGHPNSFDRATTELLERLVRHGIAADFGNEGFGRGYKFFTV